MCTVVNPLISMLQTKAERRTYKPRRKSWSDSRHHLRRSTDLVLSDFVTPICISSQLVSSVSASSPSSSLSPVKGRGNDLTCLCALAAQGHGQLQRRPERECGSNFMFRNFVEWNGLVFMYAHILLALDGPACTFYS